MATNIETLYSKKKKFNLSTPVRALSEGGLLYIINRIQRPWKQTPSSSEPVCGVSSPRFAKGVHATQAYGRPRTPKTREWGRTGGKTK